VAVSLARHSSTWSSDRLNIRWLVQDRIGRRFSLTIGSIVSAMAVTIFFFSHMPKDQNMMRAVFSSGMMVQGLSVGIIKVTTQTYVSENAPTAIRGSAMGMFPAFNLVGQLLGLLVVYIINDKGPTGYVAIFGSQWALALAPFIVSIIMPESPSHLFN
jgi:MFS family permease